MRITNGILINNSLSNINDNKTLMDKLNTQLTSEKKIQRPSDDPIVAIRALRFRSTLSEIDQYLSKNIPDANSWMEVTDEALGNVVKVISGVTDYCNQAVNGYYETTDKNTILSSLKAMRDQIYSDANSDCAGRTIFTGFKTDGTLTFTTDTDKKYQITEKFNTDSFDSLKKIVNSVDVTKVNDATIGSVNTSSIKLPEVVGVNRIRLAYDNLKDGALTIKASTPDATYATVSKKSTDADAYTPADNQIHYLADTGELIFGKTAFANITKSENFELTYTKEGFKKGELDPSQYFNCKDITDADPAKQIVYTTKNQEINYEVNFNQYIKINTQGKDVFNQAMTRDLDDMISAVNKAIDAEAKKSKIEALYKKAADGSPEQKKYQELLDICSREVDFAKSNMSQAFTDGLANFTEHQNTVSLARSDVGARLKRLELNESRLEAQQVTVKKLKTTNEEVNVTDVAIELKQASSVYDASLAAASKIVQKKLLDFL